jgi:hypothetical protein
MTTRTAVLAAQEAWQVYTGGSEKEDILKDLHVSGEHSAHSAGDDCQPAGLRGLRSSRSGSLAGIVQGGQKKTTF